MIGIVFDPISPKWLLLEALYLGGAIALLLAAYRASNEWLKASLAVFAVALLGLRILAVLPSWWLYYADGVLKWGGDGCKALDASCLKQAIKDTVVVVEGAVGFGGFLVAFWLYQKKFPKQLAPGEAKPEATGGYR